MEKKPPERYRASARDVFRDYGGGAIFLLFIEIWCIRDGWFNPDYEHIPFNRIMSYIFAPVLVFCIIMAISAGLTLRKEKQQAPPPQPPKPPSM
jgi:hypothetical protein